MTLVINERGVDGKRVLWQLVGSHPCDMCWDGIVQRGTCHESGDGYLWIMVGMDLNPVASVTVFLTETWYRTDLTADVWTHSD